MPTLRPNNSTGFTLMELLVVLTIIGLVAAMLVPRMDFKPSGLSKRDARLQLQTLMAERRTQAIEAGQTGHLLQHELPKGIALYNEGGQRIERLSFFSDGSVSPAHASINDGKRTRIDPLTGRLSDER